MVTQFPLDYLPLVLLGVVKKLINLWLNGPLKVRISKLQVDKINNILQSIESSRPNELCRKVRNIECFKMWKGTEFRTFLLYSAPIALKGVLKEAVYNNFILLSSAVRILCDEKLCVTHNIVSTELLKDFVITFKEIYGSSYVSYNVHNLLHISADVLKFGPLDDFSTFKFESFMFQIKRMIRKGNLQLQQVVNRLTEKQNIVPSLKSKITYPKLSKRKNKSNKYFELRLKNVNNKFKNQWFLSKENKVCVFISALNINNNILINYKEVLNTESFFSTPFDSSYVDIFKSDGQLSNFKTFSYSQICGKLYAVKVQFNNIFLARLIHTNINNV